MKLALFLFAAATANASVIARNENISTLSEAINKLPACGWPCWQGASESMKCDYRDVKCVCEDLFGFLNKIDPCAKRTCSDGGYEFGYIMGEVFTRINDDPAVDEVAKSKEIIGEKVANAKSLGSNGSSPDSKGSGDQSSSKGDSDKKAGDKKESAGTNMIASRGMFSIALIILLGL